MLILTGGLGATADDLTRQALADTLGVPLQLNAPALESIKRFFQRLRRPMSPSNQIQAYCPQGAECLENPIGTAPGLQLRHKRALIFAVPGVPQEMQTMFERYLVPYLTKLGQPTILTATCYACGMSDSQIGERLGELMQRERNPKVGLTVSAGIISVRVRSEFPSQAAAQIALDATLAEIKERLDKLIYSCQSGSLPEAVGQLLRKQGLTLATAESCTAGLLAGMLTEPAGASAYYLGGWVVYANALKTSLLGVPADLIASHGAVSAEVARRMAAEAAARSGADYALALTGLAGPSGATPEKPIGTVWMALARQRGEQLILRAEHQVFSGGREQIRHRAAQTALNILRLDLMSTCGGAPNAG